MRKQVTVITPLERSPVLDLHSDTTLQPRYGTVSVATRIRDAGYDVRLFCEMSGSTIDWDYVAASDYVCFSLMSFCSHRGYELMRKVRSVTDAAIICGGSHATVLGDECLDYADFAVRNEGEATCIDLLTALDGGTNIDAVAGISYKDHGRVVHTEDRAFVNDLDWTVDYSLIDSYGAPPSVDPIEAWRAGRPWFHFPVSQASRGCPRQCEFCFARRELGSRYRKRDVAAIRGEVEGLAKLLRRNFPESVFGRLPVLFVDNDFCLDRNFTLLCLRELQGVTQEYGLEYHAFTRIEAAHDPQFIRAIKDLGVAVLFLGIESVSDQTLQLYAKKQCVAGISNTLAVCRDNGMSVLGFFVLGADTDTPDIVHRSVEFAIEGRLHNVGLFSLYGFPNVGGASDMPQLIPDHRFMHHDWRFFNSNFVVHFTRNMRPSRLQRAIIAGYGEFDEVRSPGHDPQVAGLLRRRVLTTMEDYSRYLESVEEEFYDRTGHLIEERLLSARREYSKKLPL